jgi:hypothetical protein
MVAWEEFLSKRARQYIETVFSNLSAMFSRKLYAVTPRGFELKIVCFVLAFSIQCLSGATQVTIGSTCEGLIVQWVSIGAGARSAVTL